MNVLPERVAFAADGVAWSARYHDVYASRDGALGQARHVFLGGNALPQRWRGRVQFVVLEAGFGLGVNFMATWQAWRDDGARPRRLHYVAVELHPVAAADLLAMAPAPLASLAAELAQQWPLPLPGLHVLEFDDGAVRLTLGFGDAGELLPRVVVGADAIYLDGFAPARNPAMWQPALLRAVGRAARPGATLATYSSARAVREALAAAGFDLQIAPGFGHKREMLTGRYAPRWRVRRHEPPPANDASRTAVVIGAGIAGSACANALARRDWSVLVVDASATARDASALPWGLMHPHFAVDDNLLARLTRAGGGHAMAALRRTAPDGSGPLWCASGVFEQDSDEAEGERRRGALGQWQWPQGAVAWLDADAAAQCLGLRPRRGGLWWPGGLMASPPRWSAALLRSPGVERRQASVAGLAQTVSGWRVMGVDGAAIAEARAVIVAAAGAAPRLLSAQQMPVRSVPGQVTLLDAPALRGLRAGFGGDGTLLNAPDGTIALGATYEAYEGTASGVLDARSADRSNLQRLSRLLAEPVDLRVIGRFAGIRCVARDRLPYLGAVADEDAARHHAATLRGAHFEDLPRRPGLFVASAFGSRGLSFAALGAELIAAQLEGEPWPIERELARAVDPARILLRRLRSASQMTEAAASR
jgi:tRNA 5-methylaminomethyl-2-thiouridine biosynthesis bifunctional protein